MRKFAISVLLIFVTCISYAQMPGATPFSADWSMKMKDKSMNGKLHFSGNQMRQEISMEGQNVIHITDFQRKVTDMLMPEQKMYMEMAFGQRMMQQHRGPRLPDLKAYDPNNPCAQAEDMICEKAGTETVNGRATEKWIFTNKRNGETTTAWIDHKIMYPIRTVTKESQMDLTNVKEGMPDASLFEIPAGYRKFDMGDMMRGQMPPMPNNE